MRGGGGRDLEKASEPELGKIFPPGAELSIFYSRDRTSCWLAVKLRYKVRRILADTDLDECNTLPATM